MSDGALRVAKLVDVLQYGIGLTIIAAFGLFPLSVLIGAGLGGVKYGLFLVGVLTMGYATLLAWPRSPSDLNATGSNKGETQLQAIIRRVPPAVWYPIAPADRYPDWVRLYLATLWLWGTSFALEAIAGV